MLIEFEGVLRTVYNASGEKGDEMHWQEHTRRRATGACSSGDQCCRVPPCKCGTYVSCLDDNCLTARCEFCPAGFFCNCDAACARLEVVSDLNERAPARSLWCVCTGGCKLLVL